MRNTTLLVWLCLSSILSVTVANAAEPDPQQLEFFEKQIRPLLIDRCFECHANGQSKGGLSLDSGANALRGGDSGALYEPGKPDESLLIEVIGHQGDIKMPPKQKLSDAEIASLTAWVKNGAVWPATTSAPTQELSEWKITPEQRAFWSFQPVRDPAPPAVQNTAWVRNSIDNFILAELEQKSLQPVAAADRRALIRRATFDLTGLPPTPEDVEAFVADPSDDAFAKVVDRLLASPHYGERWGRYWLDVARYGEDQAHTFSARMYPNGFRYRDWVIQSLNNDMPYDRFVLEQIAGDLLDEGETAAKQQRAAALGYFALGPVYYKNTDAAKAAADELDDRVDTLTRGFLGLTVSCARCHDHKFDPIPTLDYYSLAGIFSSSEYREIPLVPPEVVQAFNEGQAAIKAREQKLNEFLAKSGTQQAEALTADIAKYMTAVWKLNVGRKEKPQLSVGEVAKAEQLHDFILDRWVKYLSADNQGKVPQLDAWFQLHTELAAAKSATDDLLDNDPSAKVQELAGQFQNGVVALLSERQKLQADYDSAIAAATSDEDKKKIAKPELEKSKADFLAVFLANDKGLLSIPKDRVEKLLAEDAKPALAALKTDLEAAKKDAPPQFPIAHSLGDGKPANMKVFIRGNPARTGPEAPRRFLSIITGDDAPAFQQGSGRLELARAIASKTNPLTARVIVNRVWQNHFGRGLVGTPSNFGTLGERPSHPDLLDHLAFRFMDEGWSLKSLHRKIMLSATYQLGASFDAHNFEVDPDNRLLWRMNRRRLDVESWRDALLAVSGNLDLTIGGASGNLGDSNYKRRTLYGKVSRHDLNGLLRLFDFPDPNITSEARTITTVPQQQLFVLNSDFVVNQAKALSAQLLQIGQGDPANGIRRAFLLLYARPVTDAELELGLAFLSSKPELDAQGQPLPTKLSLWEQYCQVLLGANEFTYLD